MSLEELNDVKGRQWEKWEDVDVSFYPSHWRYLPHADDRNSTNRAFFAYERENGGGDDREVQIMQSPTNCWRVWRCPWVL